MKKRITSWGKDSEGKDCFYALGLREEEQRIAGYVIPGDVLLEDTKNLINNSWREGGDVLFPDETQEFSSSLDDPEAVLPQGHELNDKTLLQRAIAEWSDLMRSRKLADEYLTQAQELERRIEQLPKFDGDLWEELKAFWSKTQQQLRAKLFHPRHGREIRKKIDYLFDQLKELRRRADDEYRTDSEKNKKVIQERLEELNQKVEKGLSLNPIFNQLKDLQRDIHKMKLTRGHKAGILKKVDRAFKVVKAKKYGKKAPQESGKSRLQQRYDGLMGAIDRTKNSINSDRRYLERQESRANAPGAGQLEAEMLKAKMVMIEEKISAKESKLADMLQSKADLDKKLAKEKERIAARKAQEEEARLKKQKIEEVENEIKAKAKSTTVDVPEQEIQKAAKAINEARGKKTPSTSAGGVPVQVMDAVINTASGVAAVVSPDSGSAIKSAGSDQEE